MSPDQANTLIDDIAARRQLGAATRETFYAILIDMDHDEAFARVVKLLQTRRWIDPVDLNPVALPDGLTARTVARAVAGVVRKLQARYGTDELHARLAAAAADPAQVLIQPETVDLVAGLSSSADRSDETGWSNLTQNLAATLEVAMGLDSNQGGSLLARHVSGLTPGTLAAGLGAFTDQPPPALEPAGMEQINPNLWKQATPTEVPHTGPTPDDIDALPPVEFDPASRAARTLARLGITRPDGHNTPTPPAANDSSVGRVDTHPHRTGHQQ